MRRTCSSSNPQSPFRYTKDNLKILLRNPSIKLSKLLPFYIPMTCHFMSGFRLTQFQYAHQKEAKSFRDRIVCLQEYCLIHISRIVILSTTQWHGFQSTSGLIWRVVTLQRVCWRAFVSGRGVIYTYGRNINTWERVDLVPLEEAQEVES